MKQILFCLFFCCIVHAMEEGSMILASRSTVVAAPSSYLSELVQTRYNLERALNENRRLNHEIWFHRFQTSNTLYRSGWNLVVAGMAICAVHDTTTGFIIWGTGAVAAIVGAFWDGHLSRSYKREHPR